MSRVIVDARRDVVGAPEDSGPTRSERDQSLRLAQSAVRPTISPNEMSASPQMRATPCQNRGRVRR